MLAMNNHIRTVWSALPAARLVGLKGEAGLSPALSRNCSNGYLARTRRPLKSGYPLQLLSLRPFAEKGVADEGLY